MDKIGVPSDEYDPKLAEIGRKFLTFAADVYVQIFDAFELPVVCEHTFLGLI